MVKPFLEAIDKTNKVPFLLSTIYKDRFSFNEFFFFVCTFCLLPLKYLCQITLASVYISPEKRFTVDDLDRFFTSIESEVTRAEIVQLIHSCGKSDEGSVNYDEFLRFAGLRPRIFQPMYDVRVIYREKILQREICKAISYRRKNFQKIRSYYEDNGSYPSESCGSMFRRALLHFPPPYKYTYYVENGNYEGSIRQLVIDVALKYKPQFLRLKELKENRVVSKDEPIEKFDGEKKEGEGTEADKNKDNNNTDDTKSVANPISPPPTPTSHQKRNSNNNNSNNFNIDENEITPVGSSPLNLEDDQPQIPLDDLTPRSRLAAHKTIYIPRCLRAKGFSKLNGGDLQYSASCTVAINSKFCTFSDNEMRVDSFRSLRSTKISVEPVVSLPGAVQVNDE